MIEGCRFPSRNGRSSDGTAPNQGRWSLYYPRLHDRATCALPHFHLPLPSMHCQNQESKHYCTFKVNEFFDLVQIQRIKNELIMQFQIGSKQAFPYYSSKVFLQQQSQPMSEFDRINIKFFIQSQKIQNSRDVGCSKTENGIQK